MNGLMHLYGGKWDCIYWLHVSRAPDVPVSKFSITASGPAFGTHVGIYDVDFIMPIFVRSPRAIYSVPSNSRLNLHRSHYFGRPSKSLLHHTGLTGHCGTSKPGNRPFLTHTTGEYLPGRRGR